MANVNIPRNCLLVFNGNSSLQIIIEDLIPRYEIACIGQFDFADEGLTVEPCWFAQRNKLIVRHVCGQRWSKNVTYNFSKKPTNIVIDSRTCMFSSLAKQKLYAIIGWIAFWGGAFWLEWLVGVYCTYLGLLIRLCAPFCVCHCAEHKCSCHYRAAMPVPCKWSGSLLRDTKSATIHRWPMDMDGHLWTCNLMKQIKKWIVSDKSGLLMHIPIVIVHRFDWWISYKFCW